MLNVRRPVVASVAAAAFVAVLAGAEGASAAPDVDSGRVTVSGEVVTVVDGPVRESRVRVSGGAFVPLSASLQDAPTGSTVTFTMRSGDYDRAVGGVTRRARPTPSPNADTPQKSAGPSSSATVVAAPAVSAAFTPGAHRVTLAIATPRGVRGTPATAAQARAQLASASQYWSEQSGGAVSFAADSVSAPMTLASGCADYWGMWKEAAARTRFVEGANRHLVLLLPLTARSYGCPYGLASISAGVNGGGTALVSDTTWPVLAHELGHNLGLAHAEQLLCTGGSDAALSALASKGCTIKDYGDPWDVMAKSAPNNAGSLSAPQAYRLGLLAGSAVQQVTDGTVTATLGSVSSRTGVRAVRVVDPTTKVAYFVEYRTRTGRDNLLYAGMTDGVRILREDTGAKDVGTAKPSLALDASPSGLAGDTSWGLPVGRSFRSYGGGVTLTVLSASNGRAQVSVTAGVTSSGTAPTALTPRTGILVDLSPATGKVSSLGNGGWNAVPAASYAFGTSLVTSVSGASWSVVVDGGRSMDLIGTAFPRGAKGRILVDGRSWADFDSYRASSTAPYQRLLRTVAVPSGRHTVTVVALPSRGRDTLALDAFKLR